ncbi:peptide-N-glycosidase F-related protein [Pedobacter foliorum]|uniref:peptide-N-glycosidase F-related protein n=1 Tax=Pedobacter foliorum TaxID=2739058 RepID=UPI001567893B|nr:peptide-N-glycosidase F-related protein [Pedobacter foliorum]NRF39292.1 peptide-N-glycosidase [Pedobacter foliorum]
MNLKSILTLFCLIICLRAGAQKSEISHVVTHSRATIICDPGGKGENPYPAWSVFPKADYPIRKVTMHVTLGSPDGLLTAHWDYLDHIVLRRKGGAHGQVLNYELGRMLTPYGSIYNKGWSWKWQVDVTDFAPFLRDSVEIVYVHSGYEDKTVGWALTIDFEILSGPPVVTPLGITTLWNKAYKYGDPKEKIEENLLPISYELISGAALSRIRMQHTGHGMDKPRGCSEFCSRWRELVLDGKVVDRRDMWKKCGNNPLYPQGGTWIFDRAYWCPGDLQQPDVIDVFTKPGSHKVSLQMEPYTATENIQAVENISAYLFHYSAPTQKIDVAVESIMVPSDEQRFSRLNPASSGPHISFRNLGADPIRSLTIVYGTDGFPSKTFHWKGNLPFNKVAEVVLPGEIQEKDGENVFNVMLIQPNGKKDAWSADNEMKAVFTAPEKFPSEFVLQFLTNKQPKDNSIFLVNAQQDTVFQKTASQLAAVTLYTDTIRLSAGTHSLHLIDTAGNGLQFWAQPKNGDGYLRLFDMKGNLIHAFESDCGNGEMFSFKVVPGFEVDSTIARYAFSMFPRSVVDQTQLSVVSNKLSDMTVQITVDGIVWQKHEYKSVKNAVFSYDLKHLPTGRIIVEAFMDGISKFKGRINKGR